MVESFMEQMKTNSASSIEEFSFHWKRITNYYIETSDEKEPVTKTNIPDHLLQMLHILVMEETEMSEEFGKIYTVKQNLLR